ncbi:hypothetical protein Dimus_004775 [Dionaea muscipula]
MVRSLQYQCWASSMIESLGYLIHQCSLIKALTQGISLHAAAFKCGVHSDAIVTNHIINMYAKCGQISSAQKLFDEMTERNIVSWAALISGYHQAKKPLVAVQLFSRLPLVPNESILATVVSSCAGASYLSLGQQVHARAVAVGYGSDSYVSNALISLYMKCGLCNYALGVFSSGALVPNTVSFNTLIAGFVENGQPLKGIELFRAMSQQGFVADHFTSAAVLRACTDADDFYGGLQFHCLTVKRKLDSIPFVGNVIITMYSKFEMVEEAEKVFRRIDQKDIISWNTMIAVFTQHVHDEECVNKGFDVFRELLKEKNTTVLPDDFTFSSVVAACAVEASIYNGKQIHAHMLRTRVAWDVGVENALVDMYAKCGCIGYSYTMFNLMKHPNLISWNSIISGFGNHGLGKKALLLFEQMKEHGFHPNSLTFTGLLIACNHAGLVDEGTSLFDSMLQVYGINPDIMHFACLVDMLGRAGRLDEAERYMKKSPFRDDPVILGSLLSACWLQGETVTGERLGEQLLKLKFPPATTSPFVLLSNLYASDRMWSGAAEVRRMLKGSRLKKEPGHSLIQVHGNVEKFTVGDFSHSRIQEIKDVLSTISFPEDEYDEAVNL